MRAVVVLALLAGPGCISVGAKVHAGAVRDAEGGGVQVGAAVTFGYAGERSAVVGAIGVAAGSAPTVGLDSGLHYVRLPDDGDDGRLGLRVGLGGVTLGAGEPRPYGGRLATLFVVRDRARHDPGHEKIGFGGSTRSVLAVGLEGMVGFAARDDATGDHVGLAGGAALSLEWYLLGRMRP